MSEEEKPEGEEAPKKSKMPLIIGLVLSLAGAGGGYFASSSGMILGSKEPETEAGEESAKVEVKKEEETKHEVSAVGGFVPVDPIVVSLPRDARHSHLRFAAQLEVDPSYSAEVTEMMPRIVDVMNTYLRSVEAEDFEDPNALARLRTHLLARMQIVAGAGRVRDVLIMEFVLT